VSNGHRRIDRVEFYEAFSLDNYAALVFVPLDTSRVSPAPGATREPTLHALARSTSVVCRAARRELTSMPVTVATPGEYPSGNVAVLRAAVTEMNTGSGAVRYCIGFGASAAGTRISGELLDGPTGRTLLRFSDRSASAGPEAVFGGDYDRILDDNLEQLGRDLGVLLSGFSARAAAEKG
jgi:hypothetical protein